MRVHDSARAIEWYFGLEAGSEYLARQVARMRATVTSDSLNHLVFTQLVAECVEGRRQVVHGLEPMPYSSREV